MDIFISTYHTALYGLLGFAAFGFLADVVSDISPRIAKQLAAGVALISLGVLIGVVNS